jgi:hypothetical protein
MVELLAKPGEFIFPLWDLYVENGEDCMNMIWIVMSSKFSGVVYLLQILIRQLLILFSLLWSLFMFLASQTGYLNSLF